MFLSGNTNLNGASGEADLAIPISGPKGSGTIYVRRRSRPGNGLTSRLEVEVKGTDKRIDLQPEAPESE